MRRVWTWLKTQYGASKRAIKINTGHYLVSRRILIAWLGILLALSTSAQEVADNAEQPSDTNANSSAEQPAKSPIELIGNEYENSIKLLQNRFRIDHNVEEVTMVFFREYGSAPVVLVRPDGSKIFQSQVDGENVFWYDAETYDLVSIKNPVPGPWQAVGQILQGSRVMVLSEVKLHAEPLPPILFSGEILKQTAYLTNGGEPIDYSQFRDVVELSIDLVSTNNPNFNNFGAADQQIATFEDNGRGMDEAPLDGVFTGQFNLSVPAGEWQPIFRVTSPMFTREQHDSPLRLYPNPVIINVEIDGGGNDYHKLFIDAQRDLVDIESLLIDGKVSYPNGDVQNFSITEPSSGPREHLIIAFDYGIFRVKLTAYGKTVNGRDFILDVPEYTFLVAEPELPEPEVAESAAQNDINDVIDEPEPPPEPEGMDDDTLMFWLLTVNGSILLVGGLTVTLIIVFKRLKAKGGTMSSAQRGNNAGADKKPGPLSGLLSKFKKDKS
ncbi:MAG: TIGR03503 family protein [Alteromonadaceae bacterium]|nr:TIGR03503 family protein [Alteromonadaceae bacterium]